RPTRSTLFPYTTLFRSRGDETLFEPDPDHAGGGNAEQLEWPPDVPGRAQIGLTYQAGATAGGDHPGSRVICHRDPPDLRGHRQRASRTPPAHRHPRSALRSETGATAFIGAHGPRERSLRPRRCAVVGDVRDEWPAIQTVLLTPSGPGEGRR